MVGGDNKGEYATPHSSAKKPNYYNLNGLDTVQGKIITPVFLALGKYDFVCPFYLWDSDKDRLPNLSYNLFEKSGHFPMLEEQELFDKKLTDWVKSH